MTPDPQPRPERCDKCKWWKRDHPNEGHCHLEPLIQWKQSDDFCSHFRTATTNVPPAESLKRETERRIPTTEEQPPRSASKVSDMEKARQLDQAARKFSTDKEMRLPYDRPATIYGAFIAGATWERDQQGHGGKTPPVNFLKVDSRDPLAWKNLYGAITRFPRYLSHATRPSGLCELTLLLQVGDEVSVDGEILTIRPRTQNK